MWHAAQPARNEPGLGLGLGLGFGGVGVGALRKRPRRERLEADMPLPSNHFASGKWRLTAYSSPRRVIVVCHRGMTAFAAQYKKWQTFPRRATKN